MAQKKTVNKFDSIIEYNENFKEIVTFYLFESPVENTSKRGKTFKDIGWSGSSRLQMLERYLIEYSEINKNNWIVCDKCDVEKEYEKINQSENYIVCNNEKGKVKSIIYSIRNAFAHGSFNIESFNEKIYYSFENNYKNKLKAKIRIDEETLKKWISIIKTNPEYLTKKSLKRKKSKTK